LEKTVEITSENLGILANNNDLLDFPEHIAVSSINGYVSYNKQNHSIKDNEIKLNSKTVFSQRVTPNLTAIFDGENLKLWDYKNNTLSENFKTLVPSQADAVNLAYYSTKQRLYMLNKAQNQLTSFALLGDAIAKPENALLLNPDDSKAIVDFAIDGSIYLLKPNAIIKYYAGTRTEFKTNLIDPLSDAKKIFTSVETKNLYILEPAKKRVIVLNKQGNLIYNLTNPDWNNLKDFVVDEKNKTVYLLNDSSLLKLALP
jgi:myo-inositol-hexaphosphate 3-phosphohydrolase